MKLKSKITTNKMPLGYKILLVLTGWNIAVTTLGFVNALFSDQQPTQFTFLG